MADKSRKGAYRRGTAVFFLLLLLIAVLLLLYWRKTQREAQICMEQDGNLVTESTVTGETDVPTEMETETETDAPYTVPEVPEDVPAEVILYDVPLYSQSGIAPTGCELVSAMMLLEYYGISCDLEEIVEHVECVFPQEFEDGYVYAPHPDNAFIGSPWVEESFGCYAPVVTDMMNELLPENLMAVDVTGTELETLAKVYLPQGKPVLVWATISMLENYPNYGWYLLDEDGNTTDEWYDWQANEHCLVLVGYDEWYYYFNDPYGSHGFISYSKELVEERYNSIGKYCVVVEEVR